MDLGRASTESSRRGYLTRPYPCHHIVDYYGKQLTISQLSEITGIANRTLQRRFQEGKRGKALWSLERGNAKRKPEVPDLTVRGWLAVRLEARERRRDREMAKREQLKAELAPLRRVRFA